MFILYLAIKFKKHYCLEISIPLSLSDPNLGNPDDTYRIYELIKKPLVKTPGGGYMH
jgi:hypothetical protein